MSTSAELEKEIKVYRTALTMAGEIIELLGKWFEENDPPVTDEFRDQVEGLAFSLDVFLDSAGVIDSTGSLKETNSNKKEVNA